MRATVPLSKISPSIHSVHLPTVSLPFKLQQALDVILSNYPRKTLISDGQAITKYVMNRQPPSDYNTRRRRMTNDGRDVLQTPLRYNRRECLAYAASRTQSVYGATYRVFNEISKIDTSFHPEAMLDFGSGLGTAVWAGHRVWGDSLYEYQMIDSSPLMGELSKALLNGGSDWSTELWSASSTCDAKSAINNVYFKQFLPVSSKVSYDLVVSAYSLSELPTMSLWKQVLLSLWRKTKQYLVLIEVGTPNGFGLISHARDFILKANDWDKDIIPNDEDMRGHIFAPCPHNHSCPLIGSKSICHFGQRVQLSLSQPRVFSHSNEVFTYLTIRKGCNEDDEAKTSSRVLLPVKKRTRHVICKLCCPDGSSCDVVISKGKHKDSYKEARSKGWGDTIDISHYDRKIPILHSNK